MTPAQVLPENGPQPHHFQSTIQDNLIELAGRVCYDSAKSTTKTRDSIEYHKHINEVDHRSTQEHVYFNIRFSAAIEDLAELVINRPGIFYINNRNISLNLRCINDWHKFGNPNTESRVLYTLIVRAIKNLFPLSLDINNDYYLDIPGNDQICKAEIIPPYCENSRWFTFYIGEVSRNLTHELVRHKYQTAVSQRSTRYVDESNSLWAWHPLLQKYTDKLETRMSFVAKTYQGHILEYGCIAGMCSELYKVLFSQLENLLIKDGIDKFSARKQARGAARGVLGSCLSTELIWSCSEAQLKRIINQRANEFADAEIQILFNKIYELVKDKVDWDVEISPCSDGIGNNIRIK
jgi:thymidylate synthase ThyX